MNFINDLLTDRQNEVLKYRKNGLTNQQIADIVGVSHTAIRITEKQALTNIFKARRCLQWVKDNRIEDQND